MTRLLLTAAVLAFATSAAAQDRIRIHIVPPTAEFVDETMKAKQDTVKDLTGHLEKNKRLEVVRDAAAADVVLTVVDRSASTPTVVATHTTADPLSALVNRSTTFTPNSVTIVLSAGTYTKTLTATNALTPMLNGWKGIAGNLARDVDRWVKDNHATLVARRPQP